MPVELDGVYRHKGKRIATPVGHDGCEVDGFCLIFVYGLVHGKLGPINSSFQMPKYNWLPHEVFPSYYAVDVNALLVMH